MIKSKNANNHRSFIATLPIAKLSEKEQLSLVSPVEMFKRIKDENKLVLSFYALANENITSSKQRFISHFKHPSISIREMPSCLSPEHCRMNMALDLSLFDAFEMFTGQELLDEFKKYEDIANQVIASNSIALNSNIVVGISRTLKCILILSPYEGNHLLFADRDTRQNTMFMNGSIGHFISSYFTGFLGDKQWFPLSWSKKQKDSFVWLDHKQNTFSGSTRYNTMTWAYDGPFRLDMPVASSFAEMALFQPLFEINRMNNKIDRAIVALDDVQKKYEASKNLVEKVLIAYDMQVEK